MRQQLGGTNLRVCEVQLQGNSQFELRQQKFKVSEELKTGAATALFDYIAESVGEFLGEQASRQGDSSGEEIFLGFTFSFPVEQTALDKGTLINWTKVSSPAQVRFPEYTEVAQPAGFQSKRGCRQ